METPKKKRDLKASLIERLHSPLQLRGMLCAGLLAAWFFLGYSTMSSRIDATTFQLERDHKRHALAVEIETLRAEAAQFADRLPPRSDPNEFLQHILSGVRSGPLKLVTLNPEKPRDAGLYEVATLRIELEGKYQDIDAFLRWIENNKRLLRVDVLRIDPDPRNMEVLKAQLLVLGLMGVEEVAKAATNTEADAKAARKTPKAQPKAARPKNAPPAKAPARSS